jgi:hypothetical protein
MAAAHNDAATATSAPADKSADPAQGSLDHYRLYTFEITAVLDGAAKIGDRISAIRFINAATDDSTECGQTFAPEAVGKQFVLLLRPQSDLAWSRNPSRPDPRKSNFTEEKAWAIVFGETAADLGNDGLESLKTTILETRDAERKLNLEDARLQAATLANAADETEARDAEHALLEMGPNAMDAMKEVAAKSSAIGKARLQRVMDVVGLPAIDGAVAPSGAR